MVSFKNQLPTDLAAKFNHLFNFSECGLWLSHDAGSLLNRPSTTNESKSADPPKGRALIQKMLTDELPQDSFTSISHTQDLGGFFWAKPKNPDQTTAKGFIHVGFDVEQIRRVQPETARRVCATHDEFERAPSPAALWCAKESSFKSMKGAHQPRVLSEIEITLWGHDSQCETFVAEYRHSLDRLKSLGITFTKNDHQIAISFGIYENFDIKSFGGLTLV